MAETFRRSKIEKFIERLITRKESLEQELKNYDEDSVLHATVTGQVIEIMTTVGALRQEFNLKGENGK